MARRLRALVAAAAGTTMIAMAIGAPAGWAHHGAGERAGLASDATASAKLSSRELTRVLGQDPRQNRKGLYVAEVEGQVYKTHGPDAIPVSGEESPAMAAAAKPERAPACVTGGKRVHLLYGYTPGTSLADFGSKAEHIRTITRQNNYFLNQEALASSGGTVNADLKVRCTAGGVIQVDAFEISQLANDPQTSEDESTWAVSDWRRIMAAGAQAGFNDPKVDYEVFTNAPGSSGIATWWPDERLSSQNQNNNPGHPYGAGWAIVYNSSWDRQEVSLHELGHTMGAVGNGSPHTSGAAHCWDEQDTMCYRDGGSLAKPLTYNCPAEVFDCGYDDYFDAKSEAGEYLASKWNLGNPLNAMIAFSGPGATQPPATGPTANFAYTCGIKNLPNYLCSFTSTSNAGDAAISQYYWSFGGGATGSGATASHVFNSLINTVEVLTRGVTLTVVDANGLQSSVTKNVLLTGSGGGGATDGPQASFWKSCRRMVCEFQDTSEDGTAKATNWRWDFGDGSTKDGALHPLHKYGKPGTYEVSLKVTDAAGKSDTATKTVSVSGGDDKAESATKSAVKVARIRQVSGGRAAITIRTTKGARGKIKLTSSKRGKTRTRTIRHRGQAQRVVRLRLPSGKSRLTIRFRGKGSWGNSKVRYRVASRGGKLKLRRS